SSKRVLIITEGLLVYLSAEDVGVLATDLARQPTFRYWICDIVSPGLLEMLRKGGGVELERAGAPFKFAPPEGPEVFRRYGWRPLEVRATFKYADKAHCLPWPLKLFGFFPESNGAKGKRPWSGLCFLEQSSTRTA